MRVTRLLAVALCAALVCAALGDAVTESAPSDVLQSDQAWQPLRIDILSASELDNVNVGNYKCSWMNFNAVDFDGNKVKCTDADDYPLGILVDDVLNRATSILSNKLLVQRRPVDVSMTDPSRPCARFILANSDVHTTQTDFVLYYTERPAGADGRYLRSMICSWDETTGRPTSGVINMAGQFPFDRKLAGQVQLTRELLHMLGFNTTVFAAKGMLTKATVRGVDNVPLVSSSKVLQTARDFYGCSSMPGMELDYDSTNSNAPLPYWRGRVAKDDVMSTAGNMTYITPMTIAAMEDTGFYKGNYTNAELMPWGYKAGCNFVNQRCIQGGTSNFGNLFCTDGLSSSPTWHCTSDRRAIGQCGMTQASENLPAPFRYFTSATEGGSLSTMDYCPFVQASWTTSCVDATAYVLPHYIKSDAARCFDTHGTGVKFQEAALDATCLPVSCDAASLTYTVTLSSSTPTSTPCPAGTTLDLSTIKGSDITIGTLTCPPYDEVCVQPFPQATDASSHTSDSHRSPDGHSSSSATQGGTVPQDSVIVVHQTSRSHERMVIGVTWMCVLAILVAAACLHTCLCKVSPFAYPL